MVTKRKPEKKQVKIDKLQLNKETVKDLSAEEQKKVKGGWIRPPITWNCPQPH